MVVVLAGGMIFSTLGFAGTAMQAAASPLHLQIDPGASPALNDFTPLSASSGWALLDGRLYWTADSGSHWHDITPPIPETAGLLSVHFLDPQNGRALWMNPQTDGDITLQVSFTSDAGLTWVDHLIATLTPADLDSSIESGSMDWLDEMTGWVAIQRQTGASFSAGALFHTTDGGQTWTRSSLPIGAPVHFVDPDNGWMSGGPAHDQLFRSADGGLTWEEQPLPGVPDAAQVSAVYPPVFDTPLNGLLAVITSSADASQLRFFSTTDGGSQWGYERAFPLNPQASSIPLSLLDAASAVATVPGEARFLRLENAYPDTLTNADGLSAGITTLRMLSLDTGWAQWNESTCTKTTSTTTDGATDIECTTSTKLLRTVNGGLSWEPLLLPGQPSDTLVQSSSTTASTPQVLRAAGAVNTQISIGKGFDICGAPPLPYLDIWDDYSPYTSMNLYIGGSMLYSGCIDDNVQNHLNAAYLIAARDYGWAFIPTWVGPQAPCTSYKYRISSDVATAYTQGIAEAIQAVDALALLGLTTPDKKGSIVYYDLETFAGDAACREAVKSFINGWDYQLSYNQTTSGLYGSTGCTNGLNNYINIPYPPKAIWAALWDYHPTVWNIGCISNTEWDNHERIHQYEGAHNERWGGVELNIDSNALDGIVAVPNQIVVPPPPSAIFTATPVSGTLPLTVTFNIASTANIATCSWVYGDGQIGTSCAASHTHVYAGTGIYSVTLTVSGPGGSDDLTRSSYISVTEPSQPDLVPFPQGSAVDPVIMASIPGTSVNDTLYSGQPVFIDWGFKNIGNAGISAGFQVDLFIDEQRVIDYVAPNLGAHSSAGFNDTSLTWSIPGWHTIRLVVDPGNVIVESNEDNNTWTGQFYWEAPPSVWPTIIGPSGIINTSIPNFTWAELSNALYYQLYLSSLVPNGPAFSYQLIAISSCKDSLCTQQSNSPLPPGDYQFKVGAMTSQYGLVFSPWQVFTVSGLPAAPTNLSPSGVVNDVTPTYSWSKAAGASWYELYVYPQGSSTPVVSEISIQALSSCSGTTCTWTPLTPLDLGVFVFKVRAANLSGVSAFSEGNFSQTQDRRAHQIFIPLIVQE